MEPKRKDPNSGRSKRRVHRGFVDLATSTRKHRRVYRRMASACTFGDKQHEPGHKEEGSLKGGKLKSFVYTAGGSLRYSAT